MKIIGLTGNIACGKSTVAQMFKDLGAKIIDADKVARVIVQPHEPAWKDIVEEFGQEVLSPDNTINRKKLGSIIFANDDKREKLNQITHPRIMARIKDVIESLRKEGNEVAIIEAALIVEKGGLKDFIDTLIVVTADEETQIDRLIERDGFSREEALSRIKSQMPLFEKIKHASFVIHNSCSFERTKQQVKDVWENLTMSNTS